MACHGLQIFSNEGEFKTRFGVRGRSPGQLQRPTGVAVHPSGDIIIADYDNKWVSIFSCEGKFKVSCPLDLRQNFKLKIFSTYSIKKCVKVNSCLPFEPRL